ncbi:hypothetical protein RJZ56_001910 [Blastomyces dermatitidis]|uniref:RNase MRP protein 1 RNA binding domain-containing protein n=2 Tax=Ajellomyces dermatitidis TaxID=5039 RepID=F2TS46_AJEDA|nr:uncharacterized protein BDCG_09137 [Blastomyces dermatitidis ER-3]EEQ85868.1 hypothetical protein BDCG_09137 [Blastomyces dermatitidis ER-3]EGE86059.1 hypothetical protein BDDG_09004 [Blastomyces dermatitidis ATCC 18188]
MPPTHKKKQKGLPQSSTLKSIHITLHLLYHRNKNQHHGTKWWKWLAMLKRSMSALLGAVRRWEWEWDEGDGDEDGGFRAKVLEMMRYMHVFVVPRCYVAFSTVVADTQFSALGVVLLAVLAQAAKTVASGERYQTEPDANTGTGVTLTSTTTTATTAVVPANHEESVDVDVGEVVKRSLYLPGLVVDSAASGENRGGKENGDAGLKEKKGGKSPLILDAAGEERKAGMVKKLKRESPLSQLGVDEKDGEGEERQKRKKLKTKRKQKQRDAIDDIFGGL